MWRKELVRKRTQDLIQMKDQLIGKTPSPRLLSRVWKVVGDRSSGEIRKVRIKAETAGGGTLTKVAGGAIRTQVTDGGGTSLPIGCVGDLELLYK